MVDGRFIILIVLCIVLVSVLTSCGTPPSIDQDWLYKAV